MLIMKSDYFLTTICSASGTRDGDSYIENLGGGSDV
jgi:hypothetical protein